MRRSHLSTIVAALLIVVVAGLVLSFIGRARRSPAQDAEKSLDIQRHANEPLELVDLKVSEQSVKSKIKGKYRNGDEGREGLDKVQFQDQHDWFKRVRVKLRNVSGKTIIGLQAYLYLRPPKSEVRFSVSLTGSKQLEHTMLEPGDEIEIFVDDGSWSRMVQRIRQSGDDENEAAVTLSVESVTFSDGLLWNRGQFFRQDPFNPNNWKRVDPKSPPGISRLNDAGQFRTVAFRPDEGGRRRSW